MFSIAMVSLIGCNGCSGNKEQPVTNGPVKPPEMPAIFTDGTAPSTVLVLTGEQHGYLEPCGCSDKQAGGLARRADLFRQLAAKGWNPVGIDDGGLLRLDRIRRDQTKIKLHSILKGLNEIGYQSVGVGYEELLFGSTDLYTEYINLTAEENFKLQFISANVTLFGSRAEGIPPREYQIIESGGIKIGVTGVLTDSVKQELDQAGITRDANDVSIVPAAEVLPGVIERMQADGAEVLVLMSHGAMDESKALAEQFPEFQVVVTARSVEDPKKETVKVGNTIFCEVGQKGKNAALIALSRTPEGITVRHVLMEIEQESFGNDPRMTQLMQDYQDALTSQQETILAAHIGNPEKGSYVGVDQCKTCHTKAYAVWSKTRHSQAYQSLIEGRKNYDGKWVSRSHDPECLCCHSTGWDPQEALRYESGFITLEKTPHLAGQQCENCHGPGSKHVDAEQAIKSGTKLNDVAIALRQQMKLNRQDAEKQLCTKCHDYENSPHFSGNFEKYWSKVNHPGKD